MPSPRRTRLALLAMIACSTAAVVVARGESPNATTAPATLPAGFEQELDAIDARASAWKDLTADFVQEKQSPLLRKPLVSRGSVRAKGPMSRWETTEPERTQMSVDPRTLRLYYPDQKSVEEYPIEGQLGMMAASPLPRLDTIRRNFSIVPDDGADLKPAAGEGVGRPLRALRMKPASDEIARFVDHVRVLLDTDRGLVLAFELVDPDGERTVIRFSNLRGDTGLSDDAMKLEVAPGTKVVRPLEGISAPTP